MSQPGRAARLVAILLITLVPFGPSISGGFISDDHSLIEDDVRVGDPARLRDLLMSPLWSFDFDDPSTDAPYARIHRPVVKLAFVAAHRLGGGAPWAFHALALAAHLVVVGLAFRFLERRGLGPAAVFAGTIVFAIHPTKLESVAWASGLFDTAMSLFAFCAAEAAAGFRDAPDTAVRRRAGLAMVAASAGFCSAGSKEIGLFVAPAFAFLEIALPSGREAAPSRRGARVAPVVATSVGAALAIALAAFVSRDLPGQPWRVDLLRPVAALGATLERIVVPFPSTMNPFPLRYDRAGVRVLPEREFVVGIAAFAASIAFAWRAIRRRGSLDLVVPVVLFVGTIAPSLGVEGRHAPGLVYDRFLYLPLLGVGWFVASSIDRLRVEHRRAAGLVVVALLVAGVPRLRDSVELFGDERAWYAHEMRIRPDDPLLCTASVRAAVIRRDYPVAASETSRCLVLARDQHRLALEANLVLGRVAARVLETPDREIAETRALRDAMVRFHATGALDVSIEGTSYRLRVDHDLAAQANSHVEVVHLPIAALSIRLREFDVALRWTTEALRSFRRMPDAWITHLTALARAGRYDEARRLMAEARAVVPGEATYLDAFEQALARAEGIAADGSISPDERAAAIAEALQDPYGVLLADRDRCERAVSAAVTTRCVRAALALRDRALAIRYLELRGVVAPEEKPAIDRAIRSLSERR